jgi:hypothetical protein
MRGQEAPMPVPPTYGDLSTVIKVDPDAMFDTIRQAVMGYGQGVVDGINRIIMVWNSLKLGWIGNTADEAQAFNEAWSAAMIKLFGDEVNPQVGILNQIADGVTLASINYGETEATVVKMFTDMSNSLQHDSNDPLTAVGDGLKQTLGGDSSRNLDGGPITENN